MLVDDLTVIVGENPSAPGSPSAPGAPSAPAGPVAPVSPFAPSMTSNDTGTPSVVNVTRCPPVIGVTETAGVAPSSPSITSIVLVCDAPALSSHKNVILCPPVMSVMLWIWQGLPATAPAPSTVAFVNALATANTSKGFNAIFPS